MSSEEEIYSIMFTSLKHPVRRKILRMLAGKPMTFMEMVESLGVSTSHLTYHLENLGELISKLDNNQYKLSTFGEATVNAMKSVEETPDVDTKHRRMLTFRWKAIVSALMIGVLLLAAFSTFQYYSLNQLSVNQQLLISENEQLKSWGTGVGGAMSILRDIIQIDISEYKATLITNTITYRQEFEAIEELPYYTLRNTESNLDAFLRFRNNHFSHLLLNLIESSPIYNSPQPNNIIDIAKGILARYQNFSGDAYLQEMRDLLATVNKTESTIVTKEDMKLEITLTSGTSGEFYWVYIENGVEFAPKSLKMVFENRFLKEMTDGYFIFTVGSTNMDISEEEAVQIAKNHAKTMNLIINSAQVSGSKIQDLVSVEFAPHPRAGSTGLIPYWYVILANSVSVAGLNPGIPLLTVGIYADTGQIANVQTLPPPANP